MRIAAVGDLHMREAAKGSYHELIASINREADVLLLPGDLTDRGTTKEAELLAEEFQSCTIPVLAVLGNHDVEAGKTDEIRQILQKGRITLLDDHPTEMGNVGFAGIKGFGGGFDRHMLQPWGEVAIKQFVHEAVNEAMSLEVTLAKLRTEYKVAVLHYSPVRQTVEGEPPEIFPYLGSSRIAEPLDRFNVSLVFHGHAHGGAPQGKTVGGVPVYNVSLPLLRRLNPNHPFIVVNL